MKLLNLSFVLVLVLALFSCSDDDEGELCLQSDWIGTYTGTVNCDGVPADVTVTITANGSEAIDIKYVFMEDMNSTTEVELGPFTAASCDIDVSNTVGGVELALDANLDGDELLLNDVANDGSVSSTCAITAEKN